MIGRVVSVKSKNTTVVLVERMEKHPLYKKAFKRSKKYLVEATGVKEGDIVDILKTRPISKRKHWKVVKVVGRNLVELAQEQQKEKAEEIIAEVMPAEKTKEPSVVSPQTKEKKVKTKKGKNLKA